MKRNFIFVNLFLWGLVLSPSLSATQWAEHINSVRAREEDNTQRTQTRQPLPEPEELTPEIQKTQQENPSKFTVLPLILEGDVLKVSIYVLDEELENWAENLVWNAYNDWFDNAVKWIDIWKQRSEFGDIMPILERGVEIDFIPFGSGEKGDPWPEDVWMFFPEDAQDAQNYCHCSNCAGCIRFGGGLTSLTVVMPRRGSYGTLLHEIGHTLGLADIYKEGFEKNASQIYCSKDPIKWTIMNAVEEELTCDDADGLINIIDAWTVYNLKQKYPQSWSKYVSPRVLNGWNSLCRKKKDGRPVDRYVMGTSATVLLKQAHEDLMKAGRTH